MGRHSQSFIYYYCDGILCDYDFISTNWISELTVFDKDAVVFFRGPKRLA